MQGHRSQRSKARPPTTPNSERQLHFVRPAGPSETRCGTGMERTLKLGGGAPGRPRLSAMGTRRARNTFRIVDEDFGPAQIPGSPIRLAVDRSARARVPLNRFLAPFVALSVAVGGAWVHGWSGPEVRAQSATGVLASAQPSRPTKPDVARRTDGTRTSRPTSSRRSPRRRPDRGRPRGTRTGRSGNSAR